MTSVGLDLLPVLFNLLFGEKHGHKLVAPFSNLAANVFVIDLVAKMAERILPGCSMTIDGVYQRSIDVEHNRFDHRPLRLRYSFCEFQRFINYPVRSGA